ncbi:hypothetical protein BJ170DRAFT_402159 [Xylariales sp. AK1849]|nr:hypothetical protein BJ170DRAFT_402159 [Xylariales sp. AK1849]
MRTWTSFRRLACSISVISGWSESLFGLPISACSFTTIEHWARCIDSEVNVDAANPKAAARGRDDWLTLSNVLVCPHFNLVGYGKSGSSRERNVKIRQSLGTRTTLRFGRGPVFSQWTFTDQGCWISRYLRN